MKIFSCGARLKTGMDYGIGIKNLSGGYYP